MRQFQGRQHRWQQCLLAASSLLLLAGSIEVRRGVCVASAWWCAIMKSHHACLFVPAIFALHNYQKAAPCPYSFIYFPCVSHFITTTTTKNPAFTPGQILVGAALWPSAPPSGGRRDRRFGRHRLHRRHGRDRGSWRERPDGTDGCARIKRLTGPFDGAGE